MVKKIMKKYLLHNGIQLILAPKKSFSSFVMFVTEAGTQNENDCPMGIAHLTEHQIVRILTKIEEDSKINQKIKWSNAFIKKEYTCFWYRVFNEDLFEASGSMKEMLDKLSQLPYIAKDIIDKDKEIIDLECKNVIANNSELVLLERLETKIFKGKGLSRPIYSLSDSINNINYNDVRNFINNYYKKNAYIVIAGACADQKKYIDLFNNSSFKIIDQKNILNKNVSQVNEKDGKVGYNQNIALGFLIRSPKVLKEYIAIELLTQLYYKYRKEIFKSNELLLLSVQFRMYKKTSMLKFRCKTLNSENRLKEEIETETNKRFKNFIICNNELDMVKREFLYSFLRDIDKIDFYAMWIFKSLYYLNNIIEIEEVITEIYNIDIQYINQINRSIENKVMFHVS